MLTRNKRKAEERRWARGGRKAVNLQLAHDERLLARMTRRQQQQVQVDSGLRPRKEGLTRYVGGKGMTLLGLHVMAGRLAMRVLSQRVQQPAGGKDKPV